MAKYKYTYVPQEDDERDYPFSKLKIDTEITIPPTIDMRDKVPYIFNQQNLGSCQSNSSTMALTIVRKESVILSRIFQYFNVRLLDSSPIGSDTGGTNRSSAKATNKFGIAEEPLCPYIIEDFAKTPTQEAYDNALLHKSSAYYSVSSLQEVFESLAMGLPVIMAIPIYESFESDEVARTGYVPMPNTKKEKLLGYHSMLIVGKMDNQPKLSLVKRIYNKIVGKPSYSGYTIVPNSWGDSWGDKGVCYIPYEFFNKGLVFDMWVIKG